MKLNDTARKAMHLVFLLALCTLLTVAPAHAQSAEKSGESESIENNSEKTILRWKDSHPEYTKQYAVEVQVLDPQTQLFTEVLLDDGTGTLSPVIRTAGRENKIAISPMLASGKYRYRITKFDLLGRPASPSAWKNFEIEDFVPEIASVFPPVVYIDEFNAGFFTLSGQNLFVPAEERNPRRKFVYTLEDENGSSTIITPDADKTHKTARQNGTDIVFFIDPAALDLGAFHFSAKNYRGIKTPKTDNCKFEVRYKKRIDVNVSAGYVLPYILYDDTFSTYMEQSLYPLSAVARLTFIPVKRRWGNAGIGFAGTYTRMNTENELYTLEGNMVCAHMLAVYQRVFRKKNVTHVDGTEKTRLRQFFTLEIHAGAGVTYFGGYQFHFAHNISTEPLNSINASICAGAAGQLYLTNRLYIEAGVDFIHAFVSDMHFGTVAPSVSIGWQF